MIIFKKADQLSHHIVLQKDKGLRIGFVPTMGALHQGHISLIEASRATADITVCSIFINPTQFNNPEDLKHYPVTIESDLDKLHAAGCDILFLPEAAEIYPPGHIKKHYSLGRLETILEGRFRPGHFQGVCEVVDRLLDIVQPHSLFLGQKDLQQCRVIKQLLDLTGRAESTSLNIVPTVREADGLAMSSRNLRLSEEERAKAPAIFQVLSRIRQELPKHSLPFLEQAARQELEQKGFSVDYVSIARASDLTGSNGKEEPLVALAAASIGSIRLIDNLALN
ncbi:MAG TPA: pantoate--beta-alanine ligase [Flavisolibacter sp.]|nr:pantoate--beta-alanine ligase [Flavisolibacter sp.]